MFTLPKIQQATREGLELLFSIPSEQRDTELTARVFTLARCGYATEQSAVNCYYLALAYATRQRNYASFPYFEEALEKDPQNADCHGDFAMTLLWLNMPLQAEKHALEAKKINPRNGQFDYALGKVFECQQRWDDAVQAYRRAKAKLELLESPQSQDDRFLQYINESFPRVEQKRTEQQRQQEKERQQNERAYRPWNRELPPVLWI